MKTVWYIIDNKLVSVSVDKNQPLVGMWYDTEIEAAFDCCESLIFQIADLVRLIKPLEDQYGDEFSDEQNEELTAIWNTW